MKKISQLLKPASLSTGSSASNDVDQFKKKNLTNTQTTGHSLCSDTVIIILSYVQMDFKFVARSSRVNSHWHKAVFNSDELIWKSLYHYLRWSVELPSSEPPKSGYFNFFKQLSQSSTVFPTVTVDHKDPSFNYIHRLTRSTMDSSGAKFNCNWLFGDMYMFSSYYFQYQYERLTILQCDKQQFTLRFRKNENNEKDERGWTKHELLAVELNDKIDYDDLFRHSQLFNTGLDDEPPTNEIIDITQEFGKRIYLMAANGVFDSRSPVKSKFDRKNGDRYYEFAPWTRDAPDTCNQCAFVVFVEFMLTMRDWFRTSTRIYTMDIEVKDDPSESDDYKFIYKNSVRMFVAKSGLGYSGRIDYTDCIFTLGITKDYEIYFKQQELNRKFKCGIALS